MKVIDNLFILTSKVNVSSNPFSYTKKRSIYSCEERYNQLLETINSIKKRVKNYFIILIDNSKFSDEKKNKLCNIVNIFIGRNNIQNIQKFDYITDKQGCKGTAEMFMVNECLKRIVKENLTFKNLFKLTGRYILNNNFKINKYKNEKLIFKRNKQLENYYYTCFYKIPQSFFYNYQMIVKFFVENPQIIIKKNKLGLEQYFPELVLQQTKNIRLLNVLGVTQNIAVCKNSEYKKWKTNKHI